MLSLQPLALDLFSGTGHSLDAFTYAGWRVLRVELNPRLPAEEHADIAEWHYNGAWPFFLWASPPCTDYSKCDQPGLFPGHVPDLTLARATRRVLDDVRPLAWAVENVRGARPFFEPLFGRPAVHYGSRYVWSNVPAGMWPKLPPQWKGASPHRWVRGVTHHVRSPRKRSEIPLAISSATHLAVTTYLDG